MIQRLWNQIRYQDKGLNGAKFCGGRRLKHKQGKTEDRNQRKPWTVRPRRKKVEKVLQ